ncbi:MAG: flagellar hook-associated protein FlgK [Bdellovibrionota bacterium]|jgi:flagellar hook-associated protein 1 FlgK
MTNYSAKIFNNAVSALSAQQAIIAATANNIANVNTEGYSRRVVGLETRYGSGGSTGGIQIGNGVAVTDITRMADEFLEGLTREAISTASYYETERDFMARIQPIFSLTEEVNAVGPAMTQFFSSLEDLSVNPSSMELRSEVLERAQDVVTSIRAAYETVAALQSEAEERLTAEIESVNSLTASIAELNGFIAVQESTGQVAADERDQRTKLLDQLSERISYEMAERPDGTVSITLQNGFPLVNGRESRALELTGAPSFSGGTFPSKLDGTNMKFIVFDYDSSPSSSAHLDLTQLLGQGQGSIGALLAMRGTATISDTNPFQASGALPEIAGRIESIARDLMTRFNETYRGPEATADPTAGFDPSAVDLNGNNPGLFGFFNAGSISIADSNGDGIPDNADLNQAVTDGLLVSFAAELTLAITAPEEIAAGRDVTDGTTISGGNADNLLASDGLLALKTATTTFSSDSSNTFQRANVTYDQLYNETVGRVGHLEARALTNAQVSSDNLLAAQTKRDQISAVSLDEEFTNLVKFQKAFEANARVLRSAQDILDTIIGLV